VGFVKSGSLNFTKPTWPLLTFWYLEMAEVSKWKQGRFENRNTPELSGIQHENSFSHEMNRGRGGRAGYITLKLNPVVQIQHTPTTICEVDPDDACNTFTWPQYKGV